MRKLIKIITNIVTQIDKVYELTVSKLNNDETFFINPSCCRFFLLDVIFRFVVLRLILQCRARDSSLLSYHNVLRHATNTVITSLHWNNNKHLYVKSN